MHRNLDRSKGGLDGRPLHRRCQAVQRIGSDDPVPDRYPRSEQPHRLDQISSRRRAELDVHAPQLAAAGFQWLRCRGLDLEASRRSRSRSGDPLQPQPSYLAVGWEGSVVSGLRLDPKRPDRDLAGRKVWNHDPDHPSPFRPDHSQRYRKKRLSWGFRRACPRHLQWAASGLCGQLLRHCGGRSELQSSTIEM